MHGAATAVIFACSAALRESLLQKCRVFIGWQAVEVTENIMITCCNKCQQYGHPEKFCKSKEVVCGRCGNTGHKIEACKSGSTCCATCKLSSIRVEQLNLLSSVMATQELPVICRTLELDLVLVRE